MPVFMTENSTASGLDDFGSLPEARHAARQRAVGRSMIGCVLQQLTITVSNQDRVHAAKQAARRDVVECAHVAPPAVDAGQLDRFATMVASSAAFGRLAAFHDRSGGAGLIWPARWPASKSCRAREQRPPSRSHGPDARNQAVARGVMAVRGVGSCAKMDAI